MNYILLSFAVIIIVIIAVRELFMAYTMQLEKKTYIQKHHLEHIATPWHYRIIKRIADVILSLIICIFVLPLLYIFCGLLFKLTSKGPVIFKQERYGLFGKKFVCYKFRTMYQNADRHRIAYDDNDDRITQVGHFMRKTHLD